MIPICDVCYVWLNYCFVYCLRFVLIIQFPHLSVLLPFSLLMFYEYLVCFRFPNLIFLTQSINYNFDVYILFKGTRAALLFNCLIVYRWMVGFISRLAALIFCDQRGGLLPKWCISPSLTLLSVVWVSIMFNLSFFEIQFTSLMIRRG